MELVQAAPPRINRILADPPQYGSPMSMFMVVEPSETSLAYVPYIDLEVDTLFELIQKEMVAEEVLAEILGLMLTAAFDPLKLPAPPISRSNWICGALLCMPLLLGTDLNGARPIGEKPNIYRRLRSMLPSY